MINRTMVRTKVLQTLFAYYEDGDKTPTQAKKELMRSFASTYDLYAMMLALMDELTTYAQNQIAEAEQRARVTHKTYEPNRRFADNQLAKNMFANRTLRRLMDEEHLSWESGMDAIPALFRQLQEKSYYIDFMKIDSPSVDDEKRLWRKIYTDLLPDNEVLLAGLEEAEIRLDRLNWETDLNVILSYVVKTVKHLTDDPNHPLLEMFDNNADLEFATNLLQRTIEQKNEYDTLIEKHLHNWEMNRIAMMDRVIICLALAEILSFPEIAAQVSLNEYIELSKEYSSEKSYIFINGILTEILKETKTFKLQ